MSYTRTRAAVLAGMAALTVAGCTNPVGDGGHLSPDGVVIRQGAEVVASHLGTTVTGQVTVQAGEATPTLTVQWMSGDTEVTPPHGYYLEVDPQPQAQWVPDAPGAFSGRVQGITPGSTNLRFKWMHGAVGRGHSDATRTIPVVVAQ
jgi:hypothetical protein